MGDHFYTNWKTTVDAVANLRAMVWKTVESSLFNLWYHETGEYTISPMAPALSSCHSRSRCRFTTWALRKPSIRKASICGQRRSCGDTPQHFEGLSPFGAGYSEKNELLPQRFRERSRKFVYFVRYLAADAQWRTYQNAAMTTKDARIKELEKLSEDMLFFATYCFVSCGTDREKVGDFCNGLLRNSRHFADIFEGPEGLHI